MGYTTQFQGQFNLDKLPPAEVIVQLRKLVDSELDGLPLGTPDSYCQWELTTDCMGLRWDGNEKFYDYEEWLEYIIDKLLKPAGITLSGRVSYSGEEASDSGYLTVENGTVDRTGLELMNDELETLKQFRDFVAKSSYADEILPEWNEWKRDRVLAGK